MKKIVSLLLILVIVFTSTAVFAKDKPDPANIIGDMILLRPLGFCSFVIGTSLFIVALPFAALSQSTKQTAQVMVADPFNFTFTRPLGEIESGL